MENNATFAKILTVVVGPSFKSTPTEVTYRKSRHKERDMAVNGSGIRDPARVLKISPTTVIEALKKRATPQSRK